MCVSRLRELKANLRNQHCFTKIEKGNVTSVTGSYELRRMIALSGKSYSEGDFVKQCLGKTAQIVCAEKAHLLKDISLTRITGAEWIDIMSGDLNQQLRAASSKFEHFSVAIDEPVDIKGITQLAVFMRACDSELNIYEELLELFPMHDLTTSLDIFEKVEQVLHGYGLDLSKLACLCTNDAANIVGRPNGVAAKLLMQIETSHPDSSFAPFHSIFCHQQNLCSKMLKLDHVLTLVTKDSEVYQRPSSQPPSIQPVVGR
nr:general transcription factor II-I repeat domain-containing protein 2A-like [Procambarus clarkii]